MRRLFQPSSIVSIAIIAAVAAMVAVANVRDARRAKRRPDVSADVRQAEDFLRQARVTGTAGLAKQAENLLNRVLADDPGSYEARRELGAVYLSQHRFREAIAIAEQNRAQRPSDPVNYGIIGDGHLEVGEYNDAFDAFDRMMQLRPSAAAYARVAYARELQGDLRGAVESMKLAADATGADDREGLAWTRAQLGELYLQQGNMHEAKRAFAAASQAYPGHPSAVTGYAKTMGAEGDLAGATTLLQRVAATSPTPDLLARLGDVLERAGRHGDAEKQYALAESAWRVDAPEPKNLARFLADHDRKIDEAVTIAERAAAERHDIFTEDALAWAYFKVGRIADARRAMARALRTGTKDRDILAHAAAIAKG